MKEACVQEPEAVDYSETSLNADTSQIESRHHINNINIDI